MRNVVIVIAIFGFLGCTIGEEVSGTENADQWAKNRPFTNGCSEGDSAASCAATKGNGISAGTACAFLNRADNAYFRIGYSANEGDAEWTVERRFVLIQPRDFNARLGDVCDRAASSDEDGELVTLIPTRETCEEVLGGTWIDDGYCSSERPRNEPVSTGYADVGTLEAGGVRYFDAIPVQEGAKIVVGIEASYGSPDLYVRFGSRPTPTRYNCTDTRGGAYSYCALAVPRGATQVFVAIYAPTATSYAAAIDLGD